LIDDGTSELLGADLSEGFGVGRGGGHDVGEIAGEPLDDVGPLIESEDLVVMPRVSGLASP